jgi:Niemann-Pick C1 protein
VLAVGVDNIFILVQAFQRQETSDKEALELRVGRVLESVAPSILLATIAESSCFFLGALTSMPAVRVFALNAGMALFTAFILQMLVFIPLLVIDTYRQNENRYELLCCLKQSKIETVEETDKRGALFRFFEHIYAPLLMKDYIRLPVVIIFIGWLCSSIAVINKLDVGLDQELSVPTDSYVLPYFEAQINSLRVGPPVYFVIKSNFNYSDKQKLLCSSGVCSESSLPFILTRASNYSNESYIAENPPSNWIDNYISWSDSKKCCRLRGGDINKFCHSLDSQFKFNLQSIPFIVDSVIVNTRL